MLALGFEEIEPRFSQNPALPSIKMPAKSMHQSFSEPPLVWCRLGAARVIPAGKRAILQEKPPLGMFNLQACQIVGGWPRLLTILHAIMPERCGKVKMLCRHGRAA